MHLRVFMLCFSDFLWVVITRIYRGFMVSPKWGKEWALGPQNWGLWNTCWPAVLGVFCAGLSSALWYEATHTTTSFQNAIQREHNCTLLAWVHLEGGEMGLNWKGSHNLRFYGDNPGETHFEQGFAFEQGFFFSASWVLPKWISENLERFLTVTLI